MANLSWAGSSYIGEGNANVVFANARIDKLLRLRKKPDKAHRVAIPAMTSVDIMHNYEKRNRKLFADHDLVQHELVAVSTTDIRELNELLSKMDERYERPASRRGSRLDESEGCGILLMPMLKKLPDDIVYHFKPKWLVQSPTAPVNAVRCRTCALEEMRNAKRQKLGEMPKPRFCPLYLLSQDKNEIESVTRALLPPGATTRDCMEVSRVLYRNALLARLLATQEEWNDVGFANSRFEQCDSKMTSAFEVTAVAMSIRDCTFYVKIEQLDAGSSRRVQTRLADLDPKLPTPDNIRKWREQEEKLISEGWYEAQRISAYKCKLEI